jgi:hypothetical protein
MEITLRTEVVLLVALHCLSINLTTVYNIESSFKNSI